MKELKEIAVCVVSHVMVADVEPVL